MKLPGQASTTGAWMAATGGWAEPQLLKQPPWLARAAMKLLIVETEALDHWEVFWTAGAMINGVPEPSWLALKLWPNSWACNTRSRSALVLKRCSTLYSRLEHRPPTQATPMTSPKRSRLVHSEAMSFETPKPPLLPQLVKASSKSPELVVAGQGSQFEQLDTK